MQACGRNYTLDLEHHVLHRCQRLNVLRLIFFFFECVISNLSQKHSAI